MTNPSKVEPLTSEQAISVSEMMWRKGYTFNGCGYEQVKEIGAERHTVVALTPAQVQEVVRDAARIDYLEAIAGNKDGSSVRAEIDRQMAADSALAAQNQQQEKGNGN